MEQGEVGGLGALWACCSGQKHRHQVRLDFKPSSASSQLCDLGQFIYPLCASVSIICTYGNTNPYLKWLFWGFPLVFVKCSQVHSTGMSTFTDTPTLYLLLPPLNPPSGGFSDRVSLLWWPTALLAVLWPTSQHNCPGSHSPPHPISIQVSWILPPKYLIPFTPNAQIPPSIHAAASSLQRYSNNLTSVLVSLPVCHQCP